MQKILKLGIMSVGLIAIFSLFIAASFRDQQVSISDGKWKAPPSAKSIENPLAKFKDTPKIIELGKTLYTQQCATCHGNTGLGDGVSARFLEKHPQDLTSKEFQSQTDGELFWKISNGNPPMPAFKDILQNKDMWLIVNYLRTFSSK